MTHTRRAFLAATTGLTAAIAGCTSNFSVRDHIGAPDERSGSDGAPIPKADLSMEPVEDRDIGLHRALFPREWSEKAQRVIERATQTGEATIDDQSPPIWEESQPWLYDDRVYRLSYTVHNERPATRYFWDLDPVQRANTDEIVQFDALPRLDREKFRWVGLGNDAVNDDTQLDLGETFVYANTNRDQSVLVPTPDRPIIEWKSGVRARFSIQGSNSKDATLKTYRYRAQQLAPTVAAFGKQLRDRYTFELSGLTAAERDFLQQIIEHGYTLGREHPPPEVFLSLEDRFQQHDAVEVSNSRQVREYLPRYNGQVYWSQLIHRTRTETEHPTTTG